MHPATENALNPFGASGPKLKGVDNKSKVQVFDNGGDVAPNAYSKLKSDSKARIQSMLDEPDQLATVHTSDDDMPTESTYTPRKDPSVVARVPQSTLDAIPKPTYMPGGGPAVAAPSMPQIAMPANLPVFDDGGEVAMPEVRGADVVSRSTIPNLPKARPSGAHLMAGPRDYLDRPDTIAGLERMYNDAEPSFMPSNSRVSERLVPIDPKGNIGSTTLGARGRDENGGMSDTASIPSSSMAIIHTHPYRTSPIPSAQDEDTANDASIPNFVMSRDAIYVAPPHGKNVKVANISQGKGQKLNIKWEKNNPTITDQTFTPPVYDDGGDVKASKDKSMPKSKVATIELPDAPTPQPVEETPVRGFAPAPVVRGANKFWTPERELEAGALAGESAADAYTTHKMLEHRGVHEVDPLAAPLVKHGLPGQIGAAVMGNLLPLGAEYLADKTGHPKLSKLISRVAPIVEGANVARQFKDLPKWESYPTYDDGGMVGKAESAAKAMWNKISPDASAMKAEQDSAAAGIRENMRQADEVHNMRQNENSTPVIVVPPAKPSQSDLLHPTAKYGSRPGEKRLDSQGNVIPTYDEGGNVDVVRNLKPGDLEQGAVAPEGFNNINDGEHQVAILQNGERVLTPRQAATPEAKAIPIAKGEAPVEGSRPNELEYPRTGGQDVAQQWMQHVGLNTGTQGPARNLEQGAVAPKVSQRPVGYAPMVAPKATPSAGGVPEMVLPGEKPEIPTYGDPGKPVVRGTMAPQKQVSQDEYKYKVQQLKQQHQDALEQFAQSGNPQDELRADATSRALMEYQKSNPWGSAGNHPGILGKIGHYASMAGNIAGDVFAPETMALIPGTQLNRQARAQGVQHRIETELPEVEKQRALDVAKSTIAKEGTPEQQYIDAAKALRIAQASGDQNKIAAAQGTLDDIHAAINAKDVNTKTTREDRLARMATLTNAEAKGALTPENQAELKDLRAELTVPSTTIANHNKAIDESLKAAGFTGDTSIYHVPANATPEEDKAYMADAKAQAGQAWAQGIEGRKVADEERKQDAKDKSMTGYAETSEGQTVMVSKYDADHGEITSGPLKGTKLAGGFEEMKASEISKDRGLVRVLSDVQKNITTYDKELKKLEAKPDSVSNEDRNRMEEIEALQQQSGGAAFDVGAKGISVNNLAPVTAANIKAGALDKAKQDLGNMSDAARKLLTAQLRLNTSVIAYQKALTGSARANETQLNLELTNIPSAYWDPSTQRSRLDGFQDNVRITSQGYPTNLPGMSYLSRTQNTTAPKSEYSIGQQVVQNGKTHTLTAADVERLNNQH